MGEGEVMATGALVAFTALSAGASIVKGIQANSAYTDQGIALMKQAQIAQYENELAIKQKQREIDKAAARQVMAMSKNGIVTSEGSPLEILYETMTLGQEEVDALKRRGAAQVDMYRTNANTMFKTGRSELLGGAANALTTIGTTYMAGKANGLFSGTGSTASKAGGVATGWSPSVNAGTAKSSTGYLGTLPKI